MPHLMNCRHSEDGWCLECVKGLHDRIQDESVRSVTFCGTLSSDGECFCFGGVSEADIDRIDPGGWSGSMLYPRAVLESIGCKDGKRYRFTLKAEEIGDCT